MDTLNVLTAAATAHRACCGSEHDPANGKLHGYCVVCGVEWPCDTAKAFMIGPETQGIAAKEAGTEIRRLQVMIGQLQTEITALTSHEAEWMEAFKGITAEDPADLRRQFDAFREANGRLATEVCSRQNIINGQNHQIAGLEAKLEGAVACNARLRASTAQLEADLDREKMARNEHLNRLTNEIHLCISDPEGSGKVFYVRGLQDEGIKVVKGWKEQADAANARLAAIDATKDGGPPMPTFQDFEDGHPHLNKNLRRALERWGSRGWDAAAALRVELAEVREDLDTAQTGWGDSVGEVHLLESSATCTNLAVTREEGRREERERIITMLDESTPNNYALVTWSTKTRRNGDERDLYGEELRAALNP